jgi:hypothetical protein
MFEREGNDSGVEGLDPFHFIFEGLSKVIVPSCLLHIQNVIIEGLDLLETVLEASSEVLQVKGVLVTLCTAKNRHLAACTSESELHLSVAYLHKVLAPLNEGVDFSKNGLILLEVPRLAACGVDLDHAHLVFGNFFPLFAAVDALIEVSHALLDIPTEHVLNLDFSLAPADDLIAYFGHQAAHSFGVAV